MVRRKCWNFGLLRAIEPAKCIIVRIVMPTLFIDNLKFGQIFTWGYVS
jgi:hypothetical protein